MASPQGVYRIISVGGSIIIPKTGFDLVFLKKFRDLILKQVKQGMKFLLVVGGGATCRQYQATLAHVADVTDDDLDWLGVYTTVFNAQFVRLLFKDVAYEKVVSDPTKKIKTNKSIIIISGWKPGWSTDNCATLLAKTYKAKELINLSNIDYVYDRDPMKFTNAKKIEDIDWFSFRKEIVGNMWNPGANAPFDPIASKEAEKLRLTVKMVKGTNLKEVENVLMGKKFKGTVIM